MEFGGVDGVAHIVSGTVGYIGNEVHVFPFLTTEQAVDGLDDDFDDVDVLPFVETSNVIGFGDLASMENQVDGTGVVYHIEPVAHVLSLPVNGERFAMTYIVDEQGYQFFRELIRTVVVRTVGHDGGHSVGIVEGAYKMVARCL